MKRITLITPPSVFLLDERVFPSLGILKVAASMEQSGWTVSHLDLCGYSNYGKIVAEYAKHEESPIFGLTATTPQLPAAMEILAAIRSVRVDARVILGGPHVTLVYAAKRVEVKQNRQGRAHRAAQRLEENFDCLVTGDGELAIFEACKPNAPKVVDADGFKDNGLISPLYLTRKQLTEASLPARHLVDLETYHYNIEGVNATSIVAQLGCPFNCGFCAGRNSPSLRSIRTRDTNAVIEEMVHLHTHHGIRGFMFSDDEQNLVNKQFLEFLEAITRKQRELGTEWRLRGFLKSQLFNEDQAKAMYEAGYRKILIGFESGAPQILENIQKKATQDDNTRCMDIARKAGLEVKALMSVGHPGESKWTIDATRRWLLDVKPPDFDVTIITPYPGSPYYDDAVPTGELHEGKEVFKYTCKNTTKGYVEWEIPDGLPDVLYQVELDYRTEVDYYKGDPNALILSHVWTEYLSAEEIVLARNAVEKEVRDNLGLPYYPRAEAVDCATINFDHSMGQTPILPSRMFRVS
jgi:radical SAM superfamily enzyme YgiQ (UPF0313 family)